MENDIVCIDCGIHSLYEISLHVAVKSINLHCNEIEQLDSIAIASNLEHLNVSANKLCLISGLDGLSSLCSLNLASNYLSSVTGLNGLVKLHTLNLSYNKLTAIDGLEVFQGMQYSLSHLELHGNCLSDMYHVLSCLKGIASLKHLVMKHGKFDGENPICSDKDYENKLLSGLPQLLSLDRFDRSGKRCLLEQNPSSTKMYKQFFDDMDTLHGHDLDSSKPGSGMLLVPHIDAAIEKRNASKAHNVKELKHNKVFLENQVNEGEQKNLKKSLSSKPSVTVATLNLPNEENSCSSDELHPSLVNSTDSYSAEHCTTSKKSLQRFKNYSGSVQKVSKAKLKRQNQNAKQSTVTQTTDKKTYLCLLKELECEREQRWKAEQANRKLSIGLQKTQSESCEQKALHSMVSQAVDRLKQRLLQEREINEQLKTKAQNLENENKDLLLKIENLHKNCGVKNSSNSKLQKQLSDCEGELSRLKAVHSTRVLQHENQLAAVMQQHELCKSECRKLQAQIGHLQELLVNKEEEYQKALENRHSVDSPEIQKIIAEHIACEEKRNYYEKSQLTDKLCVIQQQYAMLENEFREALCIENERYTQLQQKHSTTVGNVSKLEDLVKSHNVKEEKAHRLITNLSGIVKEQKVKIKEVEKCKEEAMKQVADKTSALDLHMGENKKLTVQLELMKQEKSKLSSQLTALQSVVDGLKEERKLWSLELAQQGSSLSKDRGRLEMKIEALNAELNAVRKSSEKDLDSIKIKTKIISDQTETISKLKEALIGKDKEISDKLDEHLLEQKKLQEIIAELQEETNSLQEENNHLTQRKQLLKTELSDFKKQYNMLLESHQELKNKWSDKAKLLGKLELQVKHISEKSFLREKKLAEERDAAIEAQKLVAAKMKEQDLAFQDQLETLSVAHNNEIKRREHNKQEEIAVLKNQIHSIEDEMREVLKDAESQKRAHENVLTKIKQTFSDLNTSAM